jgi:hypothetical protein
MSMDLFESWGTQGLFVSSTFEDMHAERDYLQEVVLPALAERLRARRHRLVPVDLRWGIDTLPLADGGDEARHLLVLHFCLDSIEKCHPCMIVLLGDRYGWVPPEEAVRQAAHGARFFGDVRDRSVTALEVEFGVLDQAARMTRTHFFQRSLPLDDMAEADRVRFSDAQRAVLAADPRERESAARAAGLLEAFRQRIADVVPAERRHTYPAGWDSDRRRVTGLK